MLAFLKSKIAPQSREQLFESQLAVLTKRGCSSSIIQTFSGNKKKILDHALRVTVAEGHVPFLPIITPCYLGYHGLTAMVRHKKKCGVVECEADRILDTEEVPSQLYYIFDVEDGTEWQGRVPEIAQTLICQNGRLPATAAEILSVALYTNTLEHHALDATGSRYGSDRMPRIWLNVVTPEVEPSSRQPFSMMEHRVSLLKSELGQPALGWWYLSSPSQGGAPSCASRLEIR